MRNFFYKRNLALILAALVLGHNAQVHAISKKNAVILSMAGGLSATVAGYLIYKACGKNKMTEDQLESKIRSVLAEFNIAGELGKKFSLESVVALLPGIGIDLMGILAKMKINNDLTEKDVKSILSKITKGNIQKLVNAFIPAGLSSRVKLEHIDDNLKKVVDLLLNIDGFKVGVTSDVLFNSLVLVLTIVVSFVVYEAPKSDEQGEKIFDFDFDFDLDTNTLKFTKKVEDNDINVANDMISALKQLNSSEDLVKFLSNLKVSGAKSLDNPANKPLIEPLLKGIKGINFELKNSLAASLTLNSDESLTIKMLNGNDVVLQWSIQKA